MCVKLPVVQHGLKRKKIREDIKEADEEEKNKRRYQRGRWTERALCTTMRIFEFILDEFW